MAKVKVSKGVKDVFDYARDNCDNNILSFMQYVSERIGCSQTEFMLDNYLSDEDLFNIYLNDCELLYEFQIGDIVEQDGELGEICGLRGDDGLIMVKFWQSTHPTSASSLILIFKNENKERK